MDSKLDPKILIIDDEADIRHLLTMSIIQMGFDVASAKNKAEAISLLSTQKFDFCLTDLKLPDGNGLDIVRHCHEQLPEMPIAVITAFGNTNTAVEAMKLGAFDFLAKPIEITHLRQLLKQALTFTKNKPFKSMSIPKLSFLSGNCEELDKLNTTLEKLPGSNAPVIIEGDLGTEKKRLAKLIHAQSSRSEFKEIIIDVQDLINQAEIAETINSPILFSEENIQKVIKHSHQSSLIICNLHLLPSNEQTKLLQIIEEKNYWFDGDDSETILDIRFIICSHKPFAEYLQEQSINEELFYRINVINLFIPSIVDRKDDLLLMFNQCLHSYANDKEFSKAAQEKLLNHTFHYNYREMENIIEKAVTLSNTSIIEVDDLDINKENMISKIASANQQSKRGDLSLDKYIELIEVQEITKALESTRWNRTEAAKLLGISFRTMRYKMKKLSIE